MLQPNRPEPEQGPPLRATSVTRNATSYEMLSADNCETNNGTMIGNKNRRTTTLPMWRHLLRQSNKLSREADVLCCFRHVATDATTCSFRFACWQLLHQSTRLLFSMDEN